MKESGIIVDRTAPALLDLLLRPNQDSHVWLMTNLGGRLIDETEPGDTLQNVCRRAASRVRAFLQSSHPGDYSRPAGLPQARLRIRVMDPVTDLDTCEYELAHADVISDPTADVEVRIRLKTVRSDGRILQIVSDSRGELFEELRPAARTINELCWEAIAHGSLLAIPMKW